MGGTSIIGRYRVLSTLGTGAMGEVLRAKDERLGRDVAIKRVKNVFGAMTSIFHARFEAEARALAALGHPSIVQVFDLGFEGETPYLVMELVEGPSLREVLDQNGPLSAPAARALGIQLSRALEAAHARGIVHRDIKPGNVLQGLGGIWKLADFGVARVPDSEMTIAGSFMGTPAYAAPEALTRCEFSPASDVFGLAVMLVESVTGSKPRGNGTLAEMMARANVPVALDGVPAELAATLAPALRIDPRQRPSASALAEALAGATLIAAASSDRTIGVADDGTIAVPDGTVAVPDGTVAVPDETAMAVGASPVAAPSRKRPLLPYLLGGALVLGTMVAVASTCTGSGEKRASKALEQTRPAPGSSSFNPDQPVRFEMPPGLDRRGVDAWRGVAEDVNRGTYDDAVERIWEFEDRFGQSPESSRLRTFLEQTLDVHRGATED